MNMVQHIEQKLKTGELVLIRRFTPYKSAFYFFLCAFNCAAIVMCIYMREERGLDWITIAMNAFFALFFGVSFFRGEDYLSIALPELVVNKFNAAKIYKVGENYFIGFSTADAELFANAIKSTEPVEELTGPIYTHKYE